MSNTNTVVYGKRVPLALVVAVAVRKVESDSIATMWCQKNNAASLGDGGWIGRKGGGGVPDPTSKSTTHRVKTVRACAVVLFYPSRLSAERERGEKQKDRETKTGDGDRDREGWREKGESKEGDR